MLLLSTISGQIDGFIEQHDGETFFDWIKSLVILSYQSCFNLVFDELSTAIAELLSSDAFIQFEQDFRISQNQTLVIFRTTQ